MAPPTPGDFERCSELRQWYKNHSGECPRRKSDDNTEATLARWLDKARSRRTRAHDINPSGRKLTASETAHLNNIMANQRPKTQRPKPPISTRGRQKSTKDAIEHGNELRQWFTNHSAKRLRRSSDDKTEASHRRSDDKTECTLARRLDKARSRRTRGRNNNPSRTITAAETAHLNNIIATQRPNMSPTDHFERCNELRQWFMNHSGERPRRRSDDATEASLANWLKMALVRRARAYNSRPSARQLTAIETEHLNSILARPQLGQVAATASATSSGATATELNAAPERAEPPAPFARKRSRQKSSAPNRFSTAELVPDVTSSHQMVQRMKRSGHAQFCF